MAVFAGREATVLVEQPHDGRRERCADGGGGDEQEGDLAQALADERAEAGPVAIGGAPRERREEHRCDCHREHALRQHVDAERLVDGGGTELLVDAGREPGVDEQVEVDQPETERDRQHEREDALHGLVARVAEPAHAPQAPQRRIRDRELDGRAEQDADGVGVEALVGGVQERQAERERAHDHDVPGHGRDGREEELVERVQDRGLQAVQAQHHHGREDHAREADAERAVIAEQAEQLRREHDRHPRDGRQARERQPPDGRGHAPGALALPLRQELVEDRHEGRAQSGVRDQRADQVGDLVRDREGVDRLALHREDPGRRGLAQHADEPAGAGRHGEQRGRDRHAAPLGSFRGVAPARRAAHGSPG